MTEPKQAEVPFTFPVTLCIRPHGRRVADAVMVPEEYMAPEKFAVLEAKLAEMDNEGVKVTAEDVGGNQVNVCLEGDDLDYKYELFPKDESLPKNITELVMNFDVYDYRKVVRAYEAGEDMFGEGGEKSSE